MKRFLLITTFAFTLFSVGLYRPVVASQGGCGSCADGANLAGLIAFNLCRDNGATTEQSACCLSTARLNYVYQNCPGCTDLINFYIEHDTCLE